jgi:hypothetical protein
MTGARHFAKAKAKRQRAAVKELQAEKAGRISGPLGVCPCTDKAACPECNGTMPVFERIRRLHARLTEAEAEELLTRIREACAEVPADTLDEDETWIDLGGES